MSDEIFELLGIDDDDDELGVRVRSYRGRAAPARRRASSRRVKSALRSALTSRMPGIPKQGPREWPLGFPIANFVNAGVTTIVRTTRPQKPVRGNRLVIDIARSAVAPFLVTLDRLLVGTNSQLTSVDVLPAAAFAPGAFHTSLALDAAQPGIDISVQYTVAGALAVGETIDVSTMLICLAAG